MSELCGSLTPVGSSLRAARRWTTSESSDVLRAILRRCARFACPCCCESTVKITSIAFNLSCRVRALARIEISMMGFIDDNAQRIVMNVN